MRSDHWKSKPSLLLIKNLEGSKLRFSELGFQNYLYCECKVKENEVTQSCRTLCDPMDSSLPGSAVHGIFQARILEWAAISFSRGSSQPRDQTCVSCIADRRFTIWATREAHFDKMISLSQRLYTSASWQKQVEVLWKQDH